MRLALLADGPPSESSTNSGVARGLLEALDAMDGLEVVALDGSLSGLRKAVVAVLSFKPTRASWRASFTKGRVSVAARTRQANELLKEYEPDAVLVLRNVYGPLDLPYCVYIDQTAAVAQREWPEWALTARQYRWRLAADKRQYSAAMKVFTAGRYLAESLVTDYGITLDRIVAVGAGSNFSASVVPGGVSPPRRKAILFVGREWERKGGDLLVRAFNRLADRHSDAELWLVGSVPAGVADGRRITDYGALDASPEQRAVLANLFSSARIFCLPVRYEPFGIALREAMTAGLPVVATRTCAIPEIVGEDCGVLVAREDVGALTEALDQLLSDSDQADTLGVNAAARAAQQQSWAQVAQAIVLEVRKALTAKGADGP